MLKLMFITNDKDVALIAERAGVDRIWIDLETLGKEERQRRVDSVKSHHSINDIRIIAPLLTTSHMLVRVDPWNNESINQINEVIDAGAQIVMLPYWKTVDEVSCFLKAVSGRVNTILLLETKEAVECLDKVLTIPGLDEIHIGLNDLHLAFGLTFMFELYANGVVESLSKKLRSAGIPFGIGGIGRFDASLLPRPEDVIAEHFRLGSQAVILSRSFCNYQKTKDLAEIEKQLVTGVSKIKEIEQACKEYKQSDFRLNKNRLDNDTMSVVDEMTKAVSK